LKWLAGLLLTATLAFGAADKEAQRSAGARLVQDLHAAIQNRARRFVIPPGDYRFDGPAARDFALQDLSDFEIEATGATFWFSPNLGVRIRNCRHVTLRGLTIDTDPLPWLQGRITAVDPAAKTMNVTVEDGFRVPQPGELKLRGRALFFDRETGRELYVSDDRVLELALLGENRIQVRRFSKDAAFATPVFPHSPRVGDRLVINDERWAGGNIFLQNCNSTLLDRVTILGSAGFAFHEEGGGGGNVYRGCQLIRRPQSNRLMASRGDGFHSSSMERGPIVEDCEFSSAGDDLLAVQGFFGIVLERISDRKFVIAAPFGPNMKRGSTVSGYGLPDGDERGAGVVESIEEVRDAAVLQEASGLQHRLLQAKRVHIRGLPKLTVSSVELDRSVSWQPLDVTGCYDFAGAGAIIRNNHLHDGHIRGILVKSRDAVVENNVVERMGHGGIVFEAELYWLEGPFNSGVKIRGNRVEDVGWGGLDPKGVSVTLAGITVGNYFGERLFPRMMTAGLQNHDIEITGNRIVRPAAFPIWIRNSNDVTVTGNRIEEPFAAGALPSVLNLSRLLSPYVSAGETAMDTLRTPYFSILLQNVEQMKVEKNQVVSAPAFYRKDFGSAVLPAKARSADLP
jgi:hypothetical protein